MIAIEILDDSYVVTIFSKVLARIKLYRLQVLRWYLWLVITPWISLRIWKAIAMLSNVSRVVWVVSLVANDARVVDAIVQWFESYSCALDIWVFLVSYSIVFVAELIWIHIGLRWYKVLYWNVLSSNWLISRKSWQLSWILNTISVQRCSIIPWTERLVWIRSTDVWSLYTWWVVLWSNTKSWWIVFTSHLYGQILSIWVLSNDVSCCLLASSRSIPNCVVLCAWKTSVDQHLTYSTGWLLSGLILLLIILYIYCQLLFVVLIIITHLSSVWYLAFYLLLVLSWCLISWTDCRVISYSFKYRVLIAICSLFEIDAQIASFIHFIFKLYFI